MSVTIGGFNMKEIEVKILEVDRDALEARLVILGAEKIFDGPMHGFIFDDEERSIKKSGKLIRLRKEGDKVILALKIKNDSKRAKSAEELEVEVDDFDTMKVIIENMGLNVIHDLKKHRVEYEVDDVRFAFDKYEGDYSHIPEFLEIEAEDEDILFRYVKLLGFSESDCKAWSGWDVFEHYKKKK
jgi:adenylate cyclase class 2